MLMPGHAESGSITDATPIERPRLWSHDALRHAQLWTRLKKGAGETNLDRALTLAGEGDELERDQRHQSAGRAHAGAERLMRSTEDRTLPPSLLLPDTDGALIEIPRVTRPALATWLFRTPTGVADADLDALLTPAERHELDAAFQALARSHHAALAANDMTLPQASRLAAADRVRGDRVLLGALLHAGLSGRLGQHLVGPEEWIFVHLTARRIPATGLRVCERCLLVFAGSRARQCRRCNRSPDRPRPYPWHTRIDLADHAPRPPSTLSVSQTPGGVKLVISASLARTPPKTTYTGTCAVCSAPYQATDGRQRHCADCATPAQRTRRSRSKGRARAR